MLAGTETLATIANHWFARFEHALATGDRALLENLFHSDSHWRDVLALTWRIGTVSGARAIAAALTQHAPRARPSGFRTDPERTAPRHVTRAGTKCVEVLFRFETALGRGSGVLRFFPMTTNEPKAWTLLTALDELKGHEEHVGRRRPQGWSYSRDFAGPNWLDLRKQSATYEDRDPAVLVVGGGQGGLIDRRRASASSSVDTLIVDRWPRVGDNWRRRYHALTLHNQVHVNHLPYMPFPPNWPVYIPKDKLANWFESYAEAMELNYWTGTEFDGGAYDEDAKRWTVTRAARGRLEARAASAARRHGDRRERHSEHPGDSVAERAFAARCCTRASTSDGEAWKGKRALVIGTGNSGHDIAQDLYSAGATVTLVQRSPTLIINCDPSAQLVYCALQRRPAARGLRPDHRLGAACAVRGRRTSSPPRMRSELDKRRCSSGSSAKASGSTDGEDGTGWQFMYLTRGGGYYFNVGCSDLIAEGKIGLAQFAELERAAEGCRSGRARHRLQGPGAAGAPSSSATTVAARVGPIWGFGEGQELRNMFAAHAAAGPVVHRRQLRAVPDLLASISRCRSRPREAGIIDR